MKTSPQWETSIDIFLFPGLILKIFSSVGIEKLYTVVLLGYFLFKFFLRKRKGILYITSELRIRITNKLSVTWWEVSVYIGGSLGNGGSQIDPRDKKT